MGENSAIEWTDHTFNPWSGCTKVSPGCANCYAEKLGARFPHLGNWGPGARRERTSEANWRKPLAWAKAARAAVYPCWVCGKQATCFGIYEDPQGQAPRPACDDCCGHGCEDGWCKPVAELRPRVFCASLADWLDPEVPAEWLADLLALIAATPELDWLLLTKRPERWRERVVAAMEALWRDQEGRSAARDAFDTAEGWINRGEAPRNVWIGTSVEDQRRADERIPRLLEIPARVRFLSCEPLLGPVDLSAYFGVADASGELSGPRCNPDGSPAIGWVIAGGESGPGARPMHPAWARSLRDQCAEAGVAFHFKQWGAWSPRERGVGEFDSLGRSADMLVALDGTQHCTVEAAGEGRACMSRVGKKAAGRLLDGREWNEVPHGAL